jgi:hypothetical protein
VTPARLFTPAHLDAIVTQLIPPSDYTHTVVGTVTEQGVQVVASFKREGPGFAWQVAAAAAHDWKTGANELEGKVLLQW